MHPRSGGVKEQVVRNLPRAAGALNVKIVAFGVVGRPPAVVVNQTAIDQIAIRPLRNVDAVPDMVMDDQVDETAIRREILDPGGEIDVRRTKAHPALRTDTIGVRVEQLEIAEDQVTNTVPDREGSIDARLLPRHSPERN